MRSHNFISAKYRLQQCLAFCKVMLQTPAQIKQRDQLSKLSTVQWHSKRLSVFARDRWCCAVCNKVTTLLEVVPIEKFDGVNPSAYSVDELLAVCPQCCQSLAQRMRQENYLLHSLRLAGFKPGDLTALSAMINSDQRFTKHLKKELERFTSADYHSVFHPNTKAS